MIGPIYDADVEASVLGAALTPVRDPWAVRLVVDSCGEHDFWLPVNARTFVEVERTLAAGARPDEVLVAARMPRDDRAHVLSLPGRCRAVLNTPHYLRQLHDLAARRRLRSAIERADEQLDAGGLSFALRDELAAAIADDCVLGGRGADVSHLHNALHIEAWPEFRDHTPPDVEYVIDSVVPAGSVGFIAAAKGCGKTWISLNASICTAAGRPALGRFVVPEARPVVYVALEGMRANLRARIGALARGLGIDPDSGELDLLHVLYKPVINLRDAQLTARLMDEILRREPGLVLFDVLRRAAHVRESGEGSGDFGEVLANTRPLVEAGAAVIFDHHNIKPNTDPDKRDGRQAGERMSGSGALYGHADFGVFITKYDRHNRVMTVELSTRDEAELGEMTVRLVGKGTGQYGGFTYTDRCVVTSDAKADAEEQRAESHEAAIRNFLSDNPGASQNAVVKAVGGKKDDAASTLHHMVRNGIVYRDESGRKRYKHWLSDDPRQPSPMMGGSVGDSRDPRESLQHVPTTTPVGGVVEGDSQDHRPPVSGEGDTADPLLILQTARNEEGLE